MKKSTSVLILCVFTLIIAAAVFFAGGFYSVFEKDTKPSVFESTTETVSEQGTTSTPETTQPDYTSLTISFTGDCLLSSLKGYNGEGSLNWYAENYPETYFFEKVSDIFFADDLTIANCETVLSDSLLTPKEQTMKVQYWFIGPASNAGIFKAGGIDFTGVVNNHSYDYGEQGESDTRQALTEAGLEVGGRDKVSVTERNGIKIGIYCCSLYSYDYVYDILEKLEDMEQLGCKLKIIYFHGGIEGERTPEKWKINACHKLADAGADVIVGSHPHVLQPMEIYNDCAIVYSLGNFCFGGNVAPEKETAIYQAVFSLKDGEITGREDRIIPCWVYTGAVNLWQPSVVEDAGKKAEILGFMFSDTASQDTSQ